MTPTHDCAFMGACRFALSIKDSIVIAHSVAGCAHGAARLHMQQNMEDTRLLSTGIYEDDIIGGGLGKLSEAVSYALDAFNPPIIVIVSGCTAVIMEDDVTGLIAETNSAIPIIHISGAGFTGNNRDGIRAAAEAFVELMTPKTTIAGSVNILGLFSDDYMSQAEQRSLAELFGNKITINSVLPACNFETLMSVPKAALNIVFRGFEFLAEALKTRFGAPYLVADYPYGIAASSALISGVYDYFGFASAGIIKASEERAFACLSPYTMHIRNLTGVPCAVVGNVLFGSAMKSLLEGELGMCVEFFNIDEIRDLNAIEKALISSPIAMLFGSSFTQGLANKLDIPHFLYCYPVTGRLTISDKRYTGYNGILYLIEDIINAAADYDGAID